MKILVLGGTFDPPHRGHLALLTAAARAVRPDRILVVPGWRTPFKTEAAAASPEDRVQLVRRGLIEALPAPWRARARIDQGELRARRRVYTVETLERLARENAGARLHFAAGSDAAAGFSRWKEPGKLARLAAWWTAARPGEKRRAPKPFRLLGARMPDVSSTSLRGELALGEGDDELAPAAARYIERRGLYGRGVLARLRASLSPERFRHTVCVARLAQRLAQTAGADPDKARLAGLLHDCGRALPVPELPRYARKRRLRVPALEAIARHAPLLLHSYVGEDVARRRYGVADAAVLSAIRNHTLGARRMSRLDRVVYVADACSEDRRYPEAPRLRALALRDLDEAYQACVRNKVEHALDEGAWLHPLTIQAWNSLQE